MTTADSIVTGSSRPDPSTLRVTVAGDLCYGTADEVQTAVTALVAHHDDVRVVELDCAAVDFCDSHGVAVLLMCRRATERAGVTLRIVNSGRKLLRVLDLTGTLELFL